MNLDDLGEIHPDSYAFPSIKLPLINARIPPVPPEMYYSQRQHQQFYQQTTVPPTTMQTGTQLINRGTEPLQAVPRIHLATPEVITVELAREVLINLTTNKNIRLCQANRIALSSTRLGHGQICALHHPNFGYVQDGPQIFTKLPSGHCAIGHADEIRLFHPFPPEPEGYWHITKEGVQLRAKHPNVDFPSKDVDVTLQAFNSHKNSWAYFECEKQIEKAAITRGQFGVQITINGIRISQSDNDGTVVVVDRNDRKLELNPTYGYGHIWGSGGHVGITAEGRAEIHLLNRHIIAAEDQIEVSIGGRQAHFDGHLWLEPTIE